MNLLTACCESAAVNSAGWSISLYSRESSSMPSAIPDAGRSMIAAAKMMLHPMAALGRYPPVRAEGSDASKVINHLHRPIRAADANTLAASRGDRQLDLGAVLRRLGVLASQPPSGTG